METEREVAMAFRRYPRSRPFANDIPYYPYLQPYRTPSPPRVNFNLGYNPFAVNTPQ